MAMPPYPLLCYTPGCGKSALFKIASQWSDGVIQELKTYGLSCEACLAAWLQRSYARQKACRLARGETLEAPGVYELVRGSRDRELRRRLDLEKKLLQHGCP